MKTGEKARKIERYIALDIHKEYVLAGGMNAAQERVMQPRRIEMGKFREWTSRNLREGDAVVLETTTNVWDIYDTIAPLVTRAVVAHAGAVRQIAEARVKTDKEDVERLIRLLIADIVLEVWVPPTHVRELRGMISYRNRLVKTGTMIRNRLQSLIHRHNLLLPKSGLSDQTWWDQQTLSKLEKIQICQELAMLAEIEKHKAEVDAELGRQSLGEVWGKQALRLMQLSGISVIVAMTVLSAIGEIERFETPKKLASYSGLTPRLEQSGTKKRGKGITKEGRRELRWALVEAALQAVKSDPLLKRRFDELQRHMHRNQAIVAIARHLLELVWYVLTRRQPYRGFTQDRIAYKYLTWAWQMKEEARDGLTRQQFARYYLMRLGIGHDLTRVALTACMRKFLTILNAMMRDKVPFRETVST